MYLFISDFEKQSPEVFCKKTVLKNFVKFTEKHQLRVSFLMKLQASACNLIQKETLAQVFPCEFCDFYRKPLVAASRLYIYKTNVCIFCLTFFLNCTLLDKIITIALSMTCPSSQTSFSEGMLTSGSLSISSSSS